MRRVWLGTIVAAALTAASCGGNGNDGVVNGPGSARLTGTVTDRATGDPIEGATVSVAGASAATPADGSYAFESVPEGAQTVTAVKAGFVNYLRSITVLAPLTVHNIEMVAGQGGGTVTGVVADRETGAPVQGVEVTIVGTTVLTAPGGTYQVSSVPEGQHAFTMAKPWGATPLNNYYAFVGTVTVTQESTTLDGALDYVYAEGYWIPDYGSVRCGDAACDAPSLTKETIVQEWPFVRSDRQTRARRFCDAGAGDDPVSVSWDALGQVATAADPVSRLASDVCTQGTWPAGTTIAYVRTTSFGRTAVAEVRGSPNPADPNAAACAGTTYGYRLDLNVTNYNRAVAAGRCAP